MSAIQPARPRTREAHHRYNVSPKGKARSLRYEWSETPTPSGYVLRTRRPQAEERRRRYELSDHAQRVRHSYEWQKRYLLRLRQRIAARESLVRDLKALGPKATIEDVAAVLGIRVWR